jgi:Uma2 family endonuclease
MIVAQRDLERRVFLGGITWETYQSLRTGDENSNLRMTYDHGALEIVSPSRKHERISYLLGRMIDQWTLDRKIAIAAGRNTTFSRGDLRRGLEPDNSYWISHEQQMRDKDEVDLKIDPPPDLVLEVDVTRSSIPKLPIYAALGVPEVWQWRLDALEVFRLSAQQQYVPKKGSVELRQFPLALVAKLLREREGKSDTTVIQEFIRGIRATRRRTT